MRYPSRRNRRAEQLQCVRPAGPLGGRRGRGNPLHLRRPGPGTDPDDGLPVPDELGRLDRDASLG